MTKVTAEQEKAAGSPRSTPSMDTIQAAAAEYQCVRGLLFASPTLTDRGIDRESSVPSNHETFAQQHRFFGKLLKGLRTRPLRWWGGINRNKIG